ncbi:MAG: PocR ligand-binding domain-containing protein [Paludibacter sp.]
MKNNTDILFNKTQIEGHNILFTDIFNIDEIQKMQDIFSYATGVASLITCPDGTPITHASNFCNLCKLVRSTEQGTNNCKKSDAHIGSVNPTGIVIQQCLSAGLWDASVGIHVDGKHIASWLVGQVRTVGVDVLKIINYADEIEVSRDNYNKALNEVPLLTFERFENIVNMLANFANELTEKAYRNYELKQNIEEQERINDLLHKSEESLSITLNSIGDAVITTDANGLINSMNPIAEAMCGWTKTETIGKPLTDIFRLLNQKTNKPIENPVEKVMRTGKIIGLANNTVLITKTGDMLHISDSAAPIKNKIGEICGVVLVFSDVTQKYINEEAIRLSEIKYRGLLNNLNSGVVVHAADTSIILCNPKASVLLGLSAEKLYGLQANDPNWMFVDENENPLPFHEFPVNRILESKEPIKDQVSGIKKTGKDEIVWVNINGFPIFDTVNKISQIVISFDDISNQKKNADMLKEKERFLRQTQLIARLGSYSLDIKTGKWDSSEMLNEILGIDENYEKSVSGWQETIHPEWREKMGDYFANEVIAKRKRFDKEYKIERKKDLIERWVHGLGELFLDSDGNPVKMIGTIQDITERKITEENIRKNEEKYRNIFENIQDVFYQVDLSGNIFEVSPSAVLFKDFFDFTIPNPNVNNLYNSFEDRRKFLELMYKDGEVRDFELDIKGKNGAIKHVSINAKLIRDAFGNPTHINGALRDITKRKNAQDALLKSEKYLKEIQTIANIGDWTIDFTNKTWTSSEILDQILGINVKGRKNLQTLGAVIHPEWVSILEEYYWTKVIPNKLKFDKKFKIIRLNDNIERWVHAIGEVKFDENNQPKLMIGTVQDITKRKRDKEALRQSQEELKKFAAHLQNVREEERNILAREIHDDLGQILIAMKIDLGLLKQNVLKTIGAKDYDDLENQFKDLSKMVDNTLISARRIMTDLRPEVLDMIGFTETVKQHLNHFQQRHKIECSFENNTQKLELNSDQSVALFRIVQESLNNVAKHSRASHVNVLLNHINYKLTLDIVDNGIGFDPNENINTDSYGLIGIRERVYLLDGELNINSTKGKGTTIHITMPYLQN